MFQHAKLLFWCYAYALVKIFPANFTFMMFTLISQMSPQMIVPVSSFVQNETTKNQQFRHALQNTTKSCNSL